MRLIRTFALAAGLGASAFGPTAAMAQDASGGALNLEFNAAQATDKGCRLVFVVKNELGKPLTRAGVELALFNAQGVVDRLSLLDFKDLPTDKTKVSRFELSGVKCADVSRLLVNAVTSCEGEGLAPDLCKSALKLSNKTDLQFGS